MKLTAVTALYDIRRESAGDGRRVSDYVAWLNRTLRFPIPFTIFLDPSIDAAGIVKKPEDTIVRLPCAELAATRWLPEVERICLGRDKFPSSQDLAYRLPSYEILMFSKFDFLERVARKTDADVLVWIDAGASRFSSWDYSTLRVREPFIDQLMSKVDLAISARHHLRDYHHGRPAPSFPGLCQTLTNGTAFMLRADAATRIRETIFRHVETAWLPYDLWDTEQTAIGEVVLAREVTTAIVAETFNWIGLLGAIFEPSGPLPFGQRWDQNDRALRRSLILRVLDVTKDWIIARYRSSKYGPPVDGVPEIIRAKSSADTGPPRVRLS